MGCPSAALYFAGWHPWLPPPRRRIAFHPRAALNFNFGIARFFNAEDILHIRHFGVSVKERHMVKSGRDTVRLEREEMSGESPNRRA
jgi:hypothetical protein